MVMAMEAFRDQVADELKRASVGRSRVDEAADLAKRWADPDSLLNAGKRLYLAFLERDDAQVRARDATGPATEVLDGLKRFEGYADRARRDRSHHLASVEQARDAARSALVDASADHASESARLADRAAVADLDAKIATLTAERAALMARLDRFNKAQAQLDAAEQRFEVATKIHADACEKEDAEIGAQRAAIAADEREQREAQADLQRLNQLLIPGGPLRAAWEKGSNTPDWELAKAAAHSEHDERKSRRGAALGARSSQWSD